MPTVLKVKLFLTSITFWLCGTAESAKQPVKKARDTTSTDMSKTGIFFLARTWHKNYFDNIKKHQMLNVEYSFRKKKQAMNNGEREERGVTEAEELSRDKSTKHKTASWLDDTNNSLAC